MHANEGGALDGPRPDEGRSPRPTVRVGISGWRYPGWRGVFYPDGLVQRRELGYAASRLASIEINGSFYSLQRPSSYRRWAGETPPDFVFAVKGGRFITHMKKLKEVRVAVANFLASGVLLLGRRLGPLLWQFPAQWGFDEARFASFLELLPRTTGAAATLAEESTLAGDRRWTEAVHDAPLRHAFEVRHPSFFSPPFVELLRAHGAALVFADSARRWPYTEDLTADFVYVRLHGAEQLYASGYTDGQLEWWADRIRAWRAGGEPGDARRVAGPAPDEPGGRDVYVYFDNDAKVHAPFDAIRLAARVEG